MSSNSITAQDAFTTKMGSLASSSIAQRSETAYEQMKTWKDPADLKQTQLNRASVGVTEQTLQSD